MSAYHLTTLGGRLGICPGGAPYLGERTMDFTCFTALLKKLKDTDSNNFILLLLTLLFLLSLLSFYGKMLLY